MYLYTTSALEFIQGQLLLARSRLRKFIYDLWGGTVNTASRIESHGIPGCIQVTDATYKLLKHNYLFEERGIIQVKGKGKMTTYLLTGRKICYLAQ